MTPNDLHRLTPPRIYLVRMAVFVVLAGFLALILYRSILAAFLANPALNGVILGVLTIGVMLAFRQVFRLFREIRWVNAFRTAEPGTPPPVRPVLLGPMATMLANRQGRPRLTTSILRSILDSVGMRLDEARDISRYLTGLLIFLGLLGTFWGLLETVGSVGRVISSMKGGADAALMFEDLKSGLAAPLGGMGISFSSSLFGLAGSLVLGFLDLQAGQAQNRFYNELEDWLASTVSDHGLQIPVALEESGDLRSVLDRLTAVVLEQNARNSDSSVASLAEGIHALVHHMRTEQQLIRDWVEAQASRELELTRILERLSPRPERL